MKRKGILACLALFMVLMMALPVFGAEKGTFTIEKTSPKDGSTGAAVENMGVKVFFSEDVYSKKYNDSNKKLCILTDKKGNKVPTRVIFSKKDPKVMLVLADPTNKKTKIEGNTEYTLVIGNGFKSADGSVLVAKDGGSSALKITFTTLNPKTSMWVSMGMMALMMGGMIFFTMRDQKKKGQEDKSAKKETFEGVNPYKEAKRTGKSVEEVLAEDAKRKEKFEAKQAKKNRQKKENKVEIKSDNLRVAKPAPISAAGSKYKATKDE